MPTYGYECLECKEKFEIIQRITDDALTKHDSCGGSLRKLLYPVGIVFKGSGFYVNDYARAGQKTSDSPSETKSEPTTETKGESKSDAKTDSAPAKTETKTESAAPVKAEAAATA